jgi:glycosyltransferase involved in cell wall biosynthesis
MAGTEFSSTSRAAVLIPCLNEEATIETVVKSFRSALPACAIFVIDNGSTDLTREYATNAGAEVIVETERGKGNALRRAFADIDADVYVMVDGDGTYSAEAAVRMVDLVLDGKADLVIANRSYEGQTGAERRGHLLGNRLFSSVVRSLFGLNVGDVLSGYRAMSRRFVKSMPVFSKGFEIEVEITAHASLLHAPTTSIVAPYSVRIDGSQSKLRTYRDGFRIAIQIFRIYRSYAPARFFGSLSLLSFAGAISSHFATNRIGGSLGGAPAALSVVGVLLFSVGVILNSQSRLQRQFLRLAYLQQGTETLR